MTPLMTETWLDNKQSYASKSRDFSVSSKYVLGVLVMERIQNIQPVPDADEADAGEFFLDGEIDGAPVRFFLDTGATFTSVFGIETLASYPSTRTMHFKGIGGISRSADIIAVKSLQVGNYDFKQTEVARSEAGPGLKTTIGVDLLQNQVFEFNAKENIFSFGQIAKTAGATFDIGKKGHIYLPVKFSEAHSALTGIWDTGAGLTVVDIADVKSNPSNFVFLTNSTGGDTTGANVTLAIYKARLLKVGTSVFHNLKVLATDLSGIRAAIGENVRVAIGYNVIINHAWHFDLKNRRWSVD
jgi:predicted aspartyl protease